MKEIIVLIILILSLNSCIKNHENVCPTEFELPGKTIPYQDTFFVGDTIKLTHHFYKFVYENNTKEEYNLENINFSSAFGIIKIDSGDDVQLSSKNNIDILNCNDTSYYWYTFSSSKNEVLFGDLQKSGDSLKFNLSFTLKKPGLFLIEFGSGLMDSNQDFEGKCANQRFDAYMRLNGSKDNNIELLKQSPIEYYNTWMYNQKDRFYKRGSFVIRVLE